VRWNVLDLSHPQASGGKNTSAICEKPSSKPGRRSKRQIEAHKFYRLAHFLALSVALRRQAARRHIKKGIATYAKVKSIRICPRNQQDNSEEGALLGLELKPLIGSG
jgi:hypothetical protein